MYNLILKGFKTKEQVEEFVSWYSGQGEQDLTVWLSEQESPVAEAIHADCMKMHGNWEFHKGSDSMTLHLEVL